MDLSLADVHPMLAMPIHRDLPPDTAMALLQTQAAMFERNLSLTVNMSPGTSIIPDGRTAIAVDFLKSECTHLFWIDSDIAWKAEDFLRLVALGTKLECVCGAYPVKTDELEFFVDFGGRKAIRNDHGCFSINGTGLGFTNVQRKVMQQLADKAPLTTYHGKLKPRVFRFDVFNGESRGEDHAFFADVRELGYEVNLDPAVTLSHIGPKKYTASIFSAMTKV